MALGPIEGTHAMDLICKLRGMPRPIASDRFVRPLQRWIAGDGSADQGYVLNHPKLGEYLREQRFDSTDRQRVEQAFLEWGRGVAKSLSEDPKAPAPPYVLRHHVSHLGRASAITLDDMDLLLGGGWGQAWYRLDKDFAGYADSLLAAAAGMRPAATMAMRRVGRCG